MTDRKAIADRNREIITRAIRNGLESSTAKVTWAAMQNGRQMVQVKFNEGSSVILPYSDFNDIALTANYKKQRLGKFVIV